MTTLLNLCRLAEPAFPRALAGSGGGPVLLLAPHPDDETLGCGACIAALADAGIPVQVALITDGGASHPRSRAFPRQRLAATRAAELKSALSALAGERALAPIELGYPDLAAPDTADEIGVAADRIGRLMPRPPTAIWTTWKGDPHPDHARTARLAQRLSTIYPDADVWAYPIWGRFDNEAPLPPIADLRLISLPEFLGRKRRAIEAHASQMSALVPDDPTGFVMPLHQQRHFADHPEIFIRMAGDDA